MSFEFYDCMTSALDNVFDSNIDTIFVDPGGTTILLTEFGDVVVKSKGVSHHKNQS